ncbi:MAG: endonuclease/exonuclease/phosphatase family protein [Candidatus Pacebacteria bacterium]|nr:endonuclease/exonuclease/phosphatase family protein [Candidatus Paceibacterota bacterium]
MPVKLVSINIEGTKHLEEKVLPFLKKQNADVITLQEVFEDDVERIKQVSGMEGFFSPMAHIAQENTPIPENNDVWGVLVLSKLPIISSGSYTYYKYQGKDELPVFFSTKNVKKMNRVLSWITILSDKEELTFATTHFTWSAKGETTPLQEEAYQNLESILDRLPISVLTGDFNAPRGKKIFSKLSERFKDNIPQDIVTTIDNNIHKAPDEINLVVDGLFTAKGIKVLNAQVVPGVSDHMAIVGMIEVENVS